jgi:hypothetical protein
MIQAGMVCLFSRIVQCQEIWDEPICKQPSCSHALFPSKEMFWKLYSRETQMRVANV